ncbi:MAG: hypothetical protein QMD14_01700 [Candidatus Aenigmarchaeota archaeon]|nr:hypothetical protein [Candidatus Aenigmarchaeota archaeon]
MGKSLFIKQLKNNKTYLIFFIFLLLFTKAHVGSWNDASRMATIESLVERGNFIIDNSTYNWTGDKVYINGHFYSDKLPVLSFLASGPYFLLKKNGLSFKDNENVVYRTLTLLFSGIPALIALLFFEKSLKLIEVRKKVRNKLLLGLGFATLLLPWSIVFNNHVITGAFLFIAFYLLLKSRICRLSFANIFVAGLLASLAIAIDMIVGIVFFFCFLLYINLSFQRKYMLFYLLATIPFLFLHSILNYQVSRTPIPVTFYPEYFFYEGSEWKLKQLSGFAEHSFSSLVTYAFHSLIGFHGLFSFSPILLIFPFALLRYKKIKILKKEVILLSVAIIVTLSFFILRTNNYGGFSYGIRWFVPLIPFMFFVGSLHLRDDFPYFLPLFIISSIISIIGVINPWTDMTAGPIPIINNLLEVVKVIK